VPGGLKPRISETKPLTEDWWLLLGSSLLVEAAGVETPLRLFGS
jgi:hypothetical protein